MFNIRNSNEIPTIYNGKFKISKTKGIKDFFSSLIFSTLLSLSLFSSSTFAAPGVTELPSGFNSVHGSVNISQSGNTLNVNSSSAKSIVNYQTFNVGSQATVNFNLPSANAAILNRVVGGNISEVYGQINSNGNVFLVNTAGIVFGGTATVNVGSIIASTLNIEDNNFINGNYIFNRTQSTQPSSIVNNGEINAGSSIVLMAGAINNTNKLASPTGVVRMVSADQATMTTLDGVTFDVDIDQPLTQAVNSYTSALSNSGSISGHSIELSTKIESAFYERAINNSGVLEATLLDGNGGEIIVAATSSDAGAVFENSGTAIVADSSLNNGAVSINADSIIFADNSSIEGDGSIHLTSNSTIDQNPSSSLRAIDLIVESGDQVSLNSSTNEVDNLSASTSNDNFLYRDSDGFSLTKADVSTGNLTLISMDGGITQIQGTVGIIANELTLGLNNGTTTLDADNNDVSTLLINPAITLGEMSPTDPNISFRDVDGLQLLSTRGGLNGVVSVTVGEAADLNGTPDLGIWISGEVNAGTFNLTSYSGDISQLSGTFTGNTLTVTGDADSINFLIDTDFNSLSINGESSNFVYFDRDGFNLLNSNQQLGSSFLIANYVDLVSDNGTPENDLNLLGNIETGSIYLENHLSTGNINQPSGYVKADFLNVSVLDGDATLLSSTNDAVEFQGASATGSVSFYDTNGLLVSMGSVGSGDLNITSSSILLQSGLFGENISLLTYNGGDINLGAAGIISDSLIVNADGSIIGGGSLTNYVQIYTNHIELSGNTIGSATDPIGIGLGILSGFIEDRSNASGLNNLFGRITASIIVTLLHQEYGLALYP
jgi:filamentous hemagglutinin family protein